MTQDNFEITQEGLKLTVRGRLDSPNAAKLGDVLAQTLKQAQEQQAQEQRTDEQQASEPGRFNIILNMFHVEYLSSTGIRVILKVYKEATAAGGGFCIEQPSECVRNVLGLVALNEMLVGGNPA